MDTTAAEPDDALPAKGQNRPAKEALFKDWDRPVLAEPPAEVLPAPDGNAPSDAWTPLIDPWSIADGIWKSRGIIVTTTLAGAALGVLIALSTPKKYESVSEILIDPRNLQIVDRDVAGSGGLPMEATLAVVENQVRILRSGPVLEDVARALNLSSDPEFNGSRSAGGIKSLISGLRALISGGDGKAGDELRAALAAEHLAESLQVERTGKTFIVLVRATTESPDKSALIANTVVESFIKASGSLQSGNTGRANEALSSRLDSLRKSVEDAERKVEAYKAENDIIDAQGRLISDDELIKLNEQLGVARAKTIELNARASSARNLSPADILAGALPEQVASAAMAELRTQYSKLAQDSARLASRLGPRHPERIDVDAQLADAKAGIATELKRIVSSIQIDLKRAVQLEQDLAARLAQLKVNQATVSDDLVELREMERDAASKRSVYESYLLRARETGEQKDINTGNFTIISRAMPPLEPTGPSRAMVAIASTLAGFLAGIGIGGMRGAIGGLLAGRKVQPRRQAQAAQNHSRSQAAGPGRVEQPVQHASAPIQPAPAPVQHPAVAQPPVQQPTVQQPPVQQPPAQQWMQQPAMPQPVWMQPPQWPVMMPQPQWPMMMQAPQMAWAQPPVMQPWAPQPMMQQPAAPEPPAAEPKTRRESSEMDEIRGTLREFRDVVRELADARALRRNF